LHKGIIVKTAIELASLNDLIRLSVNIFSLMGIKYPYIYVIRERENAWIYFIRLSQYLPFFRPILISFFYRSNQFPPKMYIEYIKERKEKIKYVGISDLVNPMAEYVALYFSKKLSVLADPFSERREAGIVYSEKIDLSGIEIIQLDNFLSLVRIASDMRNILFVIKTNAEKYLYYTGIPVPIISVSVGEFSVSPIMVAEGPPPLVNEKPAPYVKYIEEDVEEEHYTFCVGTDRLERYVPIIHVKKIPFHLK